MPFELFEFTLGFFVSVLVDSVFFEAVSEVPQAEKSNTENIKIKALNIIFLLGEITYSSEDKKSNNTNSYI
ncbi:MAG: hypothetical protein ACI9XP_000518 [Lentimonas sp.]